MRAKSSTTSNMRINIVVVDVGDDDSLETLSDANENPFAGADAGANAGAGSDDARFMP